MKRLVAALATASLLAPGALLAAGCGDDDGGDGGGGGTNGGVVSVAQAAQRTAQKSSAKLALSVRISGAGLPKPIALKASGVTALDRPAGRMTIDLAPLAQSLGAPLSGTVEVLYDGGVVNVKLPQGAGIPALPGGAEWLKLDIGALAKSAGVDTTGLDKLYSVDPASQLKLLESIGTLKKVGEVQVDGQPTTHFRGTYSPQQAIDALPAEQKDRINKLLGDLEKLAGGSEALGLDTQIPADLYVGEDGVARKITSTVKLPAQNGVPGGTVEQEYVLSDFGTKLDLTAPAAGDTYDAAQLLGNLLKQGLSGAGGLPGTQNG
ncbi:hypothetical protein [Paraconexibacter algicola]|uniref:hypothetical protein n=1 Tax=Paraconexibacter algicola TaxID=2133960 RepID=UPI00130506A4|nr:hypothetical protein [Paraconexibacter algicola]